MDIIYNISAIIFCLILGYLLGSFPTAIVIGKVFFKQDPREYGSKNAGGTNAGRLWGKKIGFLVIVIDMIKTLIPIWICWAILTFVPFGDKPLMATTTARIAGADADYYIRWSVYWLAPIGAILGHCWPCFANFKGGKGVSCVMGTLICTSWMVGFIPGLLYLLILKIKKYVSLASIITPFICATFFWVWAIICMCNPSFGQYATLAGYGSTIYIDWVAATVVTVMAAIVTIRHIGNIKRILNGTERKISWMK